MCLKERSFIPLDRPMYMVESQGKLYVLLRDPSRNNESGLTVLDMDATGALSKPSEILSTKGAVAAHLTIADGVVYCVNYISGSVTKMPDSVVTHSGKGYTLPRQEGPHTHFVCESPDSRYLFVTDLGLDKVIVYTKDLVKVSEVDIPKGHGPRHLALHNNGKTVFCANELRSTVSVLEYENGQLSLQNTVSVLPSDCTVESTTAAIRCVNDMVYVSNRGHDSISILRYSCGKLVLERTIPTYGKEPRDFWVEDDLVIVANQYSDNVSFISLEDGSLITKIYVKSPLCVICQ